MFAVFFAISLIKKLELGNYMCGCVCLFESTLCAVVCQRMSKKGASSLQNNILEGKKKKITKF